jgi:clan AA aspartic protease (TIGR02281 family)
MGSYSALQLRTALDGALRKLDPIGTDAALHQMVLIGHSQGGLLAKNQSSDNLHPIRVGSQGSGCSFWRFRTMFRTLAIALAASVVLAAPVPAQVRLDRTFPAGSASTSTKTEAPALVLGGTFVILATVNGSAPAALRVDSGATDVMLPRTVATRLIRAGSLTPADYLTTKTYRLADGSLRTQKIYRLHSLKVGTLIARDIPCMISNDDSGLLGQSFLSKAQDWSMDNRRHVLTLTY